MGTGYGVFSVKLWLGDIIIFQNFESNPTINAQTSLNASSYPNDWWAYQNTSNNGTYDPPGGAITRARVKDYTDRTWVVTAAQNGAKGAFIDNDNRDLAGLRLQRHVLQPVHAGDLSPQQRRHPLLRA